MEGSESHHLNTLVKNLASLMVGQLDNMYNTTWYDAIWRLKYHLGSVLTKNT